LNGQLLDLPLGEELPPEDGREKLYISGDLYPIDTPVEQRKGVSTKNE
jgi:hypothetical protein